jgi:3-hydroxyisobutyrate dehydrogenase
VTRIGFVGAGRMGLLVCAALAEAGHEVVATDKRQGLEAAVLACGAAWRESPAQAAAAADVLITMLPGPDEVHAAMVGAGGALSALAAGASWIDMTSNSPMAARPIRELALECGAEVLDAPVGGGVEAARERRLNLYVGGDASLLDKHRPLLEILTGPGGIAHVGGPGAGYTVKLLVNLLWFGQAVATAEALLLGKRAGIDLKVLQETLNSSAASSNFIGCDLQALFQGDYLTSFGLDGICQELATVTELARHHQVPFGLSNLIHRIYQQALARYGPADGELLAVALLEEQAGLDLRSQPSQDPGAATH